MRRTSLLLLAALAGCDDTVPLGTAEPSATEPHEARSREWMVRVADRADLVDLAHRDGLEIVHEPGRSGYALVRTAFDDPRRDPSFLADRRVLQAFRPAVIEGTSNGRGPRQTEVDGMTADDVVEAGLLWHHDALGLTPAQVASITVAVLDSGVAYEDPGSGGSDGLDEGSTGGDEADGADVAHVAAPGLVDVKIRAPWDFVDDDDRPYDEHFHGTHIASIILSQGVVPGVAEGARLMPLRILDAHNQGSEYALVEAIWWAVDNDAHVLNMSLSFPPEYVPSQPLLEALQYAADNGVVMVAAAGNRGEQAASWPAASPLVIAVGATRPGTSGQVLAPYSNTSMALDILAPGGDLTRDEDGNGYPDGILAESIAPGDPSRAGLWFAAGTSQAAAVATGVVARLLANEVPPTDIPARLQAGAHASGALLDAPVRGLGGGLVHYFDAKLSAATRESWHAAVLPYLALGVSEAGVEQVLPKARVTVVDDEGVPAPAGLYVGGQVTSADGVAQVYCVLDEAGACDLEAPIGRMDRWVDGVEVEQAWSFTVLSVVHDGIAHRPSPMIFASDALEVLLASLGPDEHDLPLAITWRDGFDDALGDLAASYAVVDEGSGFATSPFGLLLTQPALKTSTTTVFVDLDGSGFATSPLGLTRMTRLDLSTTMGSGFATSPLGLRSFSLLSFDGSGLDSGPLGLTATATYAGLPSGLDVRSLDLDGVSVSLLSGEGLDGDVDRTEIGTRASVGGWTSGYAAASVLVVSGVVPLEADGTAQAAHPH